MLNRARFAYGVLTGYAEGGEAARKMVEESVAYFRTEDDDEGYLSWSICMYARFLLHDDDLTRAEELVSEAISVARTRNHKCGLVFALCEFGLLRSFAHDDEMAEAAFEEGVRLCREAGDKILRVSVLARFGDLRCRQGRLREALDLYSECLMESITQRNAVNIARAMSGIAELCILKDHFEVGATLLGNLRNFAERSFIKLTSLEMARAQRIGALALAGLGEARFKGSFGKGFTMPFDQGARVAAQAVHELDLVITDEADTPPQ